MTHDAWIFLDILVIVFGLLMAMSMYTGTFENPDREEISDSRTGSEEPLWQPDTDYK